MSLSALTDFIRNFFKWVGIIGGTFFVLFLLFQGVLLIKNIFFPTPPTPPTVSFDKLPPPLFPQQDVQKIEYTINTVSGKLPSFPDRITVYKMEKPTPNLLALQRANQKVEKIGFKDVPTPLSPTLYRWTSTGNDLSKELLLDIMSYRFRLNSNFSSNNEIRTAKNLPNEEVAKATAASFLDSLGFGEDIVAAEKTKTSLFSITGESLTPATSLSTAQLIQVSYFQKDVNTIPLYYPDMDHSIMNVSIGGGFSGQIIAADFFYQKVSSESATYPILSSQQAFDALKNGEGYVAKYNNAPQINIQNVSLGYYIGEEEQDILQPIIVFQGDNFLAYIPAVKNEWIEH
jgi:hypothetical protein